MFSSKGTSLLYALVLVSQAGNYMPILRVWSSVSQTKVCISFPRVRVFPNRPIFPGPRRAPSKPAIDWNTIVKSNQDLLSQLQVYLNAVTPEGDAPALSVEMTLLMQELRSDRHYGVNGRPLRLLSLGPSFFSPFHAFAYEVAQMEAVSEEYLLCMS